MIKANLSRSSKQKINLVLSNKYWYEVMKAIEREDIKRALKIMALVKDTSNGIEQEKDHLCFKVYLNTINSHLTSIF